MSEKILACLSAHKSSFALLRRDRLQDFSNADEVSQGVAILTALIRSHPHAPVYLMIDSVDEEYRPETLPHVFVTARRQMLKRKLTQLFRTLPYRAAWLLGREAAAENSKRRDDQYLFLAINSSDLLRPYLELVHALRAPLAGIYLLPQTTQALVKALPAMPGGLLVVSRQHTGLRQSFFLDGHLRISRMTPIDPGNETASAFYADEIEKSRLFLYNSRHLARDAQLNVVVLDMEGRMDDLLPLLPSEATLNCTRLGLRELVDALGLTDAALPPSNAALHLYLLGRFPPAASLAPSLDADFIAHRLRTGLFAASAVFALIALGWTGYNLYRGFSNQAETQQALAATTHYQRQYEEAAKQFPAAPASAEAMKQAVETAAQVRKLARTPEPLMQAVSEMLRDFPQIELNRLYWRHAPDLPTSTIATVGEKSAAQAEIEAEIRPFTGDYRSALTLIESFANKLRNHSKIATVTIAKLPVDLDPGSTLTGGTQDSPEARPGSAGFKLQLVLEPAP